MITKRTSFLSLLIIGLASFAPTLACASTFQSGDNVHITPLHEIDDDFYAVSNQIIVDGAVSGDFVGLGNQASTKGTIGGSANFGCRFVEHGGSVDGSLRFMGERLSVNGRVGGSVLGAGATIMINQGSVIEKDVDLSAGEIYLDGTVLGRADCDGGQVRITGQIGGDLHVEADKITIAPPAVIRGNFSYDAESEDVLTLEPGVTIIGETIWNPPEEAADDSTTLTEVAYTVAYFLAAFFFGVIIISFFRPQTEESFQQLRNRPTVTVAAGLLTLVGLILAIIVLGLSLGGALVGSVLLGGDLAFLGVLVLVLSILAVPISSFATVSGAVLFYSGKIVVGLVLGYLILRPVRKSPGMSKLGLFVGLILISIGSILPYIGTVIYFLTAMVGAGALVLGIHHCRRDGPPGSPV